MRLSDEEFKRLSARLKQYAYHDDVKRIEAERAQLVAIAEAADQYRAANASDDRLPRPRLEWQLREALNAYFGPAPAKDEK